MAGSLLPRYRLRRMSREASIPSPPYVPLLEHFGTVPPPTTVPDIDEVLGDVFDPALFEEIAVAGDGRMLAYTALAPSATGLSRDIVVVPEGGSAIDVIRESSQDADLVMLGMSVPEAGEEDDYAARLMALVEGLPSALLVRNAGPFRGSLI